MRVALAAAAVAAVAAAGTPAGAAAHHRHRHHRYVEPAGGEARSLPPPPPPLQDRAAYQSGFAFGLLDLGISGTPTALSPYAGAGIVGPRYDRPGFGFPGY